MAKELTEEEVIKHVRDWWGTNIAKDAEDESEPVFNKLNEFLSDDGCGFGIYKNEDLGHYNVGEVRIMKFGPGCTYETADSMPERYPDTKDGPGWRYALQGTYSGELIYT